MEGMITDLTLSKENQNHFQEYLSNNQATDPGIDLTVTILTTGFWPSYKSSDLSLPVEMVKRVEVFKEFYQTKTKHRKLTWICSLGTCNINARFEQKPIELIVGTYQEKSEKFVEMREKQRCYHTMSRRGYARLAHIMSNFKNMSCGYIPENTKCKLLHWCGDGVISEGRIASTDPKIKVHHVSLGGSCWKVWVDRVLVEHVDLIRPNSEMTFLDEAIGSTIAWFSKFIVLCE